MCGIAGVLRRDGAPADPGVLGPMLDAIAHRGPDGRGAWSDGPFALGHVRLAILDPSERGRQPMTTPDGQGVLVYNGEVYNHLALRAELEREGDRFESTSDAEVVLRALHRWGPRAALPRFDGMFALAYLDRRTGDLWLARDPLGIKPLVVAERGPLLLFASEAKALLAHPAVEPRVDRHDLVVQLLVGRVARTRTLFEGLSNLEPGTWRKEGPGGREVGAHFDLFTAVDPARILAAAREDPEQHVEEVEGLLRESVRLHLASDVPLAALVSGGIDSGLVAALARPHLPTLEGYLADVEGESERERAEAVARHLGLRLHAVRVARAEWLRTWPEATLFGERPVFHASDPALLLVNRRCRKDGYEVLLTGEGSDELFGGYDWHAESHRRFARRGWRWRLHHTRRRRRAETERLQLSPLVSTLGRADAGLRRRLVLALDTEAELSGLRLFEHLAAVPVAAERAFLAQGLEDLVRHLSSILMRHDRMAMATGIETRVPFLESRLIDRALHLPYRAKWRDRRPKWVVRRVADRHLPRGVIDLPKKGFPVPPAFAAGTETLLCGGRTAELLGWSRATTERLVSWIVREPAVRFQVVSTELWLRVFFGGERPEALGEALVAAASLP